MFSVKIPDIDRMDEKQRTRAIKQWMQSVNIQVRQELSRLEKLIKEGQKSNER